MMPPQVFEENRTLPLPSIFEPTIFEPKYAKCFHMTLPSRFIKPIHPKTMIAPTKDSISKVIASGWWGQPKVHGHRAQIHIPSGNSPCLIYNRKGQLHKEVLPEAIADELKRIFRPAKDWNVIDAEWLKPKQTIFVFDFLKQDGKILDNLSFAERYELLPKLYLSPYISTLPVFKTVERCMSYLSSDLPPFIEGLVFRSAFTRGFADSSIVRCRL